MRNDGMFIPCEDVQARLKASEMSMDDVVADANRAMQMYTNWANGEGWGWVVQQVGGETDTCWGYYTIEHARAALAEAFADKMERAIEPGHILLRLGEHAVRAQIAEIIAADPALANLTADAVGDSDIRAACLAIVDETDLPEERGAAEFRAALAAIRLAERRLNRPRK